MLISCEYKNYNQTTNADINIGTAYVISEEHQSLALSTFS